MAELKTKPTSASVSEFLSRIADPERRADCKRVAALMKKATGNNPKMWGPSIVGFGTYHYVYASGQSGDWPIAGFSPRKNDLVLYLARDFAGSDALLRKLGKHKTGVVCLYLKRLADVDLAVLEKLIGASVKHMRKKYPTS